MEITVLILSLYFLPCLLVHILNNDMPWTFLVEQAKSKGYVLGSRMMGGGFGGCTINLVAKNESENFKTQAAKAFKAKFNKDGSICAVKLSDGTHIIK